MHYNISEEVLDAKTNLNPYSSYQVAFRAC